MIDNYVAYAWPQSVLTQNIEHILPCMPLTCCSWRISSLRSSTLLWSSRLSWESRSVPSSAFSDSLVDSIACRLASRLWRLRCWELGKLKKKILVDETWGKCLTGGHFERTLGTLITLGINVFSDCCLFSFSIFISDRILSLDALNFLCCVSICCIWFISWSISLLIRECSH